MKTVETTTSSTNSTNAVLGAVYRLIIVLLAPLFMCYMMLPPLWLLGIPYWILTNRSLMNDWRRMYGV